MQKRTVNVEHIKVSGAMHAVRGRFVMYVNAVDSSRKETLVALLVFNISAGSAKVLKHLHMLWGDQICNI